MSRGMSRGISKGDEWRGDGRVIGGGGDGMPKARKLFSIYDYLRSSKSTKSCTCL